jgi:hypothetical protein
VPCSGTCDANRCLIELASAPSPGSVVVDDAYAYFTTCDAAGSGSTMRVDIAGGAPMRVSSGATCPTGAALDAKSLYVTGLDPSGIAVTPLDSGAGSALDGSAARILSVSPGAAVVGIAVDQANVYVTTTSGSIIAAPISGAPPSTLASGEKSLTAPAVDGASVFFGAPIGGTVKKVPVTGGSSSTLATVDTVRALALAGPDVCAAAGYLVVKVPKDGGPPTTLGTAAGAEVVTLAVDDESVYFASYADVWKIPLSGGATVRLAGGQSDVTSIAVDSTSVYWTNAVRSPSEPKACCGRVVKLTPK